MIEKPLLIDNLDGYQFECLVAKILKKKGYKNIFVTSKSHDLGKDIIMNDEKGVIFLVECKHQYFVGRPIIQKLQGAINYEETQNQNNKVKGIIVTSGGFSKEAIEYVKEIGNEIELIDGKKLSELCENLNIVIVNGKVQIISDISFKTISKKELQKITLSSYSKIPGSDNNNTSIVSEVQYIPSCYIEYDVKFDTFTSIGCIDNYEKSGKIIIDGVTGQEIDKDLQKFYFEENFHIEKIKEEDSYKKILYTLTENDIEEYAINVIIKENTHQIKYNGKNKVTYSKTCIPKRKDIEFKEFTSVYMPKWINELKIKNMKYKQEFYFNKNNKLILEDELKQCKICKCKKDKYEKMNVCLKCGRIVCFWHRKIDYVDKNSRVCSIHAIPIRVILQKKYFAHKENAKKYKDWLKTRNIFQKMYEDKIVFFGSIFCIILLISIF